MKRRNIYLLFILAFSISIFSDNAQPFDKTKWSEEKVGKIAFKADKAAGRKKWHTAIKYGEKMLVGSIEVFGEDNPTTISNMKKLNRYYDKAGRLDEIPKRVKIAYLKSKAHFKVRHDTTVISRLLFYKSLILQGNYLDAIPLVYENISTLTDSNDDQFKHIDYLKQLHGLYGAVNRPELQENVLLQQLTLNRKLVGISLEDNFHIIINLARSYCLQKKTKDFKKLIQTYNLKFNC